MKYLKMILIAIPTIAILILAYSGGYNIYLNARTTDSMVVEMCKAATTEDLLCHCYESYGRVCPVNNL